MYVLNRIQWDRERRKSERVYTSTLWRRALAVGFPVTQSPTR